MFYVVFPVIISMGRVNIQICYGTILGLVLGRKVCISFFSVYNNITSQDILDI